MALSGLIAGLLIAAPASGAPLADIPNYPMRYMGAAAPMTTAPNGAITYQKTVEALAKTAYLTPIVEEITDGVWVIGGHSIVNVTVIEAPEGLIVYDTGDTRAEGAHMRQVIEEKISKRPIRAIIYSHSHYVGGAGALVDDPKSVIVIGHPKLNETFTTNQAGGGAPSALPELGPVLTSRAAVQFNNFLPDKGADAPLGAKLVVGGEIAFLPVTHPVEDGEKLKVAGLDLQFFTKYISDDYSTTVWIPQKKVALNNFFWVGTPNLYSLRGSVYRDPQVWRDGLRVVRDLQPDYLVNSHARSVSGRDQVGEALTNYMDLISLTYDQTLRGILMGLGPEDLRHFVYQPRTLREAYYNAQTYGESQWYPPSIYLYQMGWFDRDPAELAKLPPRETSVRLVALMGGRDKVLAESKAALDRKEYAWAAQLANYLRRIDPQDKDVRAIQAQAFRSLGQLSTASIARAFLISEARALEGQVTIPQLMPPSLATIQRDPGTFVNYMRVRIDPRKGEPVNKVVTFLIDGKLVGLHVRNGIAEFLPDPGGYLRKADIALSMDAATWAPLYLDPTGLKAGLAAGKVKILAGTPADAELVFGLFDPLVVGAGGAVASR